MASTPPFSRFEFMIAWRYLRAKRAEGGVSVMTWISLIGITLAVFALIVTLAVRSGFRTELVSTFLGSNAHVTVYSAGHMDEAGQMVKGFADYDAIAAKLAAVPGVTEAAPQIKGQVMVTAIGDGTSGAEVFGLRLADLKRIPRIGDGADAYGNLAEFDQGIAIGSGLARTLGVTVGDKVRVISPSGVKSPMGFSPRINAYKVVYIFTSGNYLIDQSRMYMPFAEAQSYFNRENLADEFAVMVQDPEAIDSYGAAVMAAAGQDALLWTWKDFRRKLPERAEDRGQCDVPDHVDPRADLDAEHHLGPDHAGEKQGPRHRHPAHDGADRRLDPAGILSSAARLPGWSAR